MYNMYRTLKKKYTRAEQTMDFLNKVFYISPTWALCKRNTTLKIKFNILKMTAITFWLKLFKLVLNYITKLLY